MDANLGLRRWLLGWRRRRGLGGGWCGGGFATAIWLAEATCWETLVYWPKTRSFMQPNVARNDHNACLLLQVHKIVNQCLNKKKPLHHLSRNWRAIIILFVSGENVWWDAEVEKAKPGSLPSCDYVRSFMFMVVTIVQKRNNLLGSKY